MKQNIKAIVGAVGVVIIGMAVAGCSGGEAEKVVADANAQIATLKAEKDALSKEVNMFKEQALAGSVYRETLKKVGHLEAEVVSVGKDLEVPISDGVSRISFDVAGKCKLYMDAGFDESEKSFVMIPAATACAGDEGGASKADIEGFVVSPGGDGIDVKVIEVEGGKKSAIVAAGTSFEVFYRKTQ